MIQRVALPNLAKRIKINSQNSQNSPIPKKRHQFRTASQSLNNCQSPSNHKQNSFEYHHLSSNQISISKNPYYLKTQSTLQSQFKTLQIKMVENPEIFHTKIKNLRNSAQKKKNLAPYFYKIQNSLKILQNSEDLKRKMSNAKIQASRTKTNETKSSKKKILRKLTNRSNQMQFDIENINLNDNKSTIIQKSSISTRKEKIKTQGQSYDDLIETLKNRKDQLAQNAKQAKYSFQHFNSGQIFAQIALINQNRIFLNSNSKQYRTSQSGIDLKKLNFIKNSKKLNAKKQFNENFKDQYNIFLGKILPSSFGENGNKSCIYQEYVLRRKANERRNIKSKLVEQKYLRTQPSTPDKSQFIFSNDIQAIADKALLMEKMFQEQKYQKKDQNINQKAPQTFINDQSLTQSKVGTKSNTKNSTLRFGQTLHSKLKLRKLAKIQQKEKNKLQNKQKRKEKNQSRNSNSTLSNYHNNVSESEMSKLLQKSNFILGKQQGLQLILERDRVNKNDTSYQLNEFDAKYLFNVDKLLSEQQSSLRKENRNLTCPPWKISIKGEEKKNTQ